MNAPLDPNIGLFVYVIAFLATGISAIIDFGIEHPWSKESPYFGDFDLGVSMKRWRHFAGSARTMFFAAIVASLVELAHIPNATVIGAIIFCVVAFGGYLVFTVMLERVMADGFQHAADAVAGCPLVAEKRRTLFEVYCGLDQTLPLIKKNEVIGGYRQSTAAQIREALTSHPGGYKLLNRHAVTMLLASVCMWIFFGFYMFPIHGVK